VVGLLSANAEVNGWTESGADSLNTVVGGYSRETLAGTAGLRGFRRFGADERMGLELRGFWRHEFKSDGGALSAGFAGSGGSYNVTMTAPASDGFLAGGEFSAAVSRSVDAVVSYDGSFGDDTAHQLWGGARFRFGASEEVARRMTPAEREGWALTLLREGRWVEAREQFGHVARADRENLRAQEDWKRLDGSLRALGVGRPKHEAALAGRKEWRFLRDGVIAYVTGDDRAGQVQAAYAGMVRGRDRYAALLEQMERSGTRALTAREKAMEPEQYLGAKRMEIEAMMSEARYQEALARTQELLLLDPENARDWERLAQIYFALGEKEKAARTLEQSLKLEAK
jgi:tetratricopeptide (TPR) repeat protein